MATFERELSITWGTEKTETDAVVLTVEPEHAENFEKTTSTRSLSGHFKQKRNDLVALKNHRYLILGINGIRYHLSKLDDRTGEFVLVQKP